MQSRRSIQPLHERFSTGPHCTQGRLNQTLFNRCLHLPLREQSGGHGTGLLPMVLRAASMSDTNYKTQLNYFQGMEPAVYKGTAELP